MVSKTAEAKRGTLRFWILSALGGALLLGTVSGCSTALEKYNKQLVEREWSRAHNSCWKLFSRIDPERKKEYRVCMRKKGWMIQ